MRSATSPGGTPRARSSSRCECSPTDAVTDQRHPAPSPPSRRWPDRGEIFPSGTEAAADRDITTAAASPGPGQHPLCRLVTRQARSDGTTWRSDEDRQAPQPATGGDLERTSHGSPARKSPRVTPIDGITLSDRQFGENARSAAVTRGRWLIGGRRAGNPYVGVLRAWHRLRRTRPSRLHAWRRSVAVRDAPARTFAAPMRLCTYARSSAWFLVPGDHLIAGFNPTRHEGGRSVDLPPAPDAVDRSVKAGDRTII